MERRRLIEGQERQLERLIRECAEAHGHPVTEIHWFRPETLKRFESAGATVRLSDGSTEHLEFEQIGWIGILPPDWSEVDTGRFPADYYLDTEDKTVARGAAWVEEIKRHV